MKPNSRTTTQQRGFTLTQMVITLAIIAVVSTGGVLGIRTARAEFRLQNSARLFATYIEKARADAIRRHAATGLESSVETFGPGSNQYAITMDYYGSGVVETRTFELESGLSFATAAKKVTFDWRGRITEAWVFQIHSDYLERNLPVDVSGSGDITVGEQHFPDQLIPPVEIAEVTGDVDSTPTPTPTPTPDPSGTPPVGGGGDPEATPTPTPTPTPSNNGNGNGPGGNNGNGNGNSSPTPTATPTPTPNGSPSPSESVCTSAISPVELNLSQSDSSNHTGSAVFTMVNGAGTTRIISASIAGNGNSLVLGVGLQRIDGSGSSVITVTTKNGAGNRGSFIVNVSATPSCGSTQQLKVNVSN